MARHLAFWLSLLRERVLNCRMKPLFASLAFSLSLVAGEPFQTPVFVSGKGGYHTYRIPALVVSKKGTLLAFCEGRKTGRGDHGDLDLILKRSTDNGKTWGKQILVHEEGGEVKITIGNPCPVVDQSTGFIWMSLCRDNRKVFITHSEDDGMTWARPRDISGVATKPNWTWVATGPGNGIQLTRGKFAGRLVMPCDHRTGGRNTYNTNGHSHSLYSDDHGKTWVMGKPTDSGMNECAVVELVDGRLMLNMRSYRGKNRRAVALSRDGGTTWGHSIDDPTLVEPVCQASFIRFTDTKRFRKNRLLFSNPASKARNKLTVRISYDEGKTWPLGKILNAGPAAYSNLTILADHSIGNLYERGEKNAYETITFARFELEWLTDGKDEWNWRKE